ncbi:ATP-utilizing phosphoenolpyruvate carboxykinase [Planctomycetales bacterium 10988]|nr:ATP-utilizing phosphoenolpyruvate carboxykinase [Planctomycetales bacterium 10988]
MTTPLSLNQYGIVVTNFHRNLSPAKLYEMAIKDEGAGIVSTGALATRSGIKTGRSPKDKRIVAAPESKDDIWWGEINIPMEEDIYIKNRQRALDYFNTRDYLFIQDGYAGWDPKYRIKVRVICCQAYHALFMHNMLLRPTPEELEDFGNPDFIIFNAGRFPANPFTTGMTSRTSIDLSFEKKELVILGTEYAGEMKKGVFTVMNYLMPKRDVLSMHCSANEGKDGDVSLFFGLSGTGKTTLSADPKRLLIGDDEHCWTEEGIFNIEGGCYAKCVGLTEENEPEIYHAIHFGAVLENVVFDENSREVDYTDSSITENTRTAYPIEFIESAKIPCISGHPNHILLLTCDAFGVLPPVSRLSPAQAMYHFISGYTAKVAGTEMGVTEPSATFSACFGAAFLVWPPTKYAEMLAERIRKQNAHVWLINTGWTGGSYGKGSRMRLSHTRAIIDAIHSGELEKVDCVKDPIFQFDIPQECPGVPAGILQPRQTWSAPEAYDKMAISLAARFQANFQQYTEIASEEILQAGPVLPEIKSAS